MIEALKAKWLCKFAEEEDAMWKNMVETKCGVDILAGEKKESVCRLL